MKSCLTLLLSNTGNKANIPCQDIVYLGIIVCADA